MKHFSRLGWIFVAVSGAVLAAGSNRGFAQPISVFNDTTAYFAHNSQSYLGIDIHDIDNDRAAALKLKDPHGAEIVTVDHDAPANKAGLKIHDAILEMNGQRVEGSDQLRRMLRETPPGRTVSFVICRDGLMLNISVQLADRAKVEANAWSQHFTVPDPSEAPEIEGLSPPSSRGFGNGFFGVFATNGLYVGADVDVLSTQLASYFGVSDGTGLLVKSVDENSPAATAGLKAGDVITKVNNGVMASRADWLKTLHSNRGKQVQLTVMRNKKEQTLSMQAGEPKKKGELELPGFCPDLLDEPQLSAELNDSLAVLNFEEMNREMQTAMNSIDAQKLSTEMQQSLGAVDFKKIQKEMQELENDLRSFELQSKQ
jgi:serine protease Do